LKSAGSIEFRAIGHPSTLKVIGKGSEFDGQFEVKSTEPQGKASFELAFLETGIQIRDKHMKEKYLQLAKYPQAELSIHQIFLLSSEKLESSVSDLLF